MPTFTRDGLTFDVIEGGPADGEPVVLLHGFPQHASSWDGFAPRLHEAGYRTLAFSQRGYSPGARPPRRRDYRIPLLADQVAAGIDQLAGGRAHVVGHDWGSVAAWAVAERHPGRVTTLTALSVPHVGAFLRAMVTSVQGLRSWYMYLFQLPWLPERILRRFFVSLMGRAGATPAMARRDAAAFESLAAVRAAINWYRAMPFADPRATMRKVTVPTLFVWSDEDEFIARKGVDLCASYVTGPYTLEVLDGVNHWIPDLAPDRLARPLLDHLRRAG